MNDPPVLNAKLNFCVLNHANYELNGKELRRALYLVLNPLNNMSSIV